MRLATSLVALALIVTWTTPPAAAPLRATFVRLYPDAGYLYGTIPPAWGDLDGDDDIDLPTFLNHGDLSFEEMGDFRELLMRGNYHGAAWCDYDRDGLLDVVLLSYPHQATNTVLLHNLGDHRFENVAPALGMDVQGFGETAVWGDFNADGWPDLYTPYYGHVFPFRSFLYMNDGHGGFVERAVEAGVAMAGQPINLKPEGAHAVDWDDDGDLDLYCASHLFLNDGTGHFTDVIEQVGLPRKFDEGVMFVDYDNDGDFDLFLRNLDMGRLYRNDAGRYVDVTVAAGIPRSTLMWGDNWADVDHDGDLDLVYFVKVAPAQLLLNQGDGTFQPDPDFPALRLTEGFAAFGDADGDGDLDMATGARPYRIYLNQLDRQPGFKGTSLRVRVLDAEGRRTQYGATVKLKRLDVTPATIQTRAVDGGSGYLTQNEYDVHFGVDPHGRYALSVSFPSAPGARVIVDATIEPLLTNLRPGELRSSTVVVHRDGRVTLDLEVPTLVSLVSAESRGDRVMIQWFTADRGLQATVERREEGSSWFPIGEVRANGSGIMQFEDAAVSRGRRYGYRLVTSGAGEVLGEVWLAVERTAAFDIEGTRPHPATSEQLRVAFSTPAAGPATLEVLDLAGRRVHVETISALEAGHHVMSLSPRQRLAPGVYVIRLAQGSRSVAKKAVLSR